MRPICLAAALALAACSVEPPGGFGVNLTIVGDPLPRATRALIDTVRLRVDGEATAYFKDLEGGGAKLRQGDVRVHYIPGVSSGELLFTALALDAGKAVLAESAAVPVTLVPARAVAATLTLGAPDTSDLPSVVDDLATLDLVPLKAQGAACTDSGECATAGGCVDGYCCDTACTGECTACNVPTHLGECRPLEAGASPAHGSCGPDLPSTCMRDGTCDGAGGCRLHPLGTVCRASMCASGSYTAPSLCDGNGACTNVTPMPCDPYVCKDTSVCWDHCDDDTACKAPQTCDAAKSCGTKPNGASCMNAAECTSNFCVDGVCCNNDCTGACRTCSLVTPGTCTNVPDGQDPDGDCPAGSGSNAICSPGACNGSGSCRSANAGTPCAASCASGTPSNTVCDAAGACTQTVTGTACNSPCQDCVVSANQASCSNHPNGEICAVGYCSGNYKFSKSTCNNGACPSQIALGGCGTYACYVDGNSDPQCYTNCGCCSIYCLCGSRPQNCASGHSCDTATYECK